MTKRRMLEWTPQRNITTWELAMCIPVFSKDNAYEVGEYLDSLEQSCQRHWTSREVNEDDLIVYDATSQPRITNTSNTKKES